MKEITALTFLVISILVFGNLTLTISAQQTNGNTKKVQLHNIADGESFLINTTAHTSGY
jgi:hypothetical protein